MQRIPMLLTVALMSGCSQQLNTSSSTQVPDYYHYYPYWYDDQGNTIVYYPGCCGETDNNQTHKKVELWWNSLDEEEQLQVKDKVENWKENRPEPKVTEKPISNKKKQMSTLPKQKKIQIKQSIKNKEKPIIPIVPRAKNG
ncbi:hypothetical protein HRJ45_01365 [Vibrio coralliilyticus]|uniref:hypothetical protein n=1 Tax=Vibrio coralliilyticus TaxID=190893 RepID=UPI00155F96C8|nr:hypothetical protein [Vibrio coralliilyticus]NRF23551.1 hypothetical protein [Vibrio coralliilyticus]NRF77738.1 hypothetical protein [Vibrio coralliilyticus]